ncbi:MAG TPA: hypothetical protein VEI02_15395, partial [Planctomycetota bacterium]|nr:hypothetical protein [Planctomycetota bacterium]
DAAKAAEWRETFRRGRELKNRIDGLRLRLRSEPGHAPSLSALARAYAEAGAHRDAVPWFARAVAASPDDRPLLRDAARSRLSAGDLQGAASDYRRLAEGDCDAALLLEAAAALEKAGDARHAARLRARAGGR